MNLTTDDLEELQEWFDVSEELATLKNRELKLRKAIFTKHFDDPKEGVNNISLPNNYILKADRKINRSIDEAMLNAMGPELTDEDFDIPALVKWKPSLQTAAYRKLSDERRVRFDQVLDIKDGTPALKIVEDKKAK